ncbi:THUMP domain-containing protein 1 [Mortierella polycephala]|uniref:THUMP domain-containing protein 1 n=1 Tax=Mortierella polycephala TaxID=41804 RepID=A0A9P6U2I8_9FUNG|nr:THUMP domain-containing protein 1 [Mortierella polycephala]
MAGNNKRKAGKGGHGGSDGKKAKADIHKVGKYLPSGFPIDPKMKGVMVTCARGKETQAGAEACDLLSEYAEKLYGYSSKDEPEETDEEESIEDAVAREIAQAKKTKGGKKFLPLRTGTDCVIFIRAMEIEPSELCHHVLSDLQKSGSKRTRFIPVDETCYANMDDIETMADRVLKPYFHAENQQPTTFKVIPKIRHNDKVDREVLLRLLANSAGRGENHKVDMNSPRFIILAEVIKSICFMSVVKDYDSLKKYNIQSIFEAAQKKDGQEKKTDDEKVQEVEKESNDDDKDAAETDKGSSEQDKKSSDAEAGSV